MSESTPSGLLLVFSEPGPSIHPDHHIPQLLSSATPSESFLSSALFRAVDGLKPSYAACYDLPSPDVPSNSTLVETPTKGTKETLEGIEVLETRTYSTYSTPANKLTPPSASYDPKKTAKYAEMISVHVREENEEEFNRWYDEEHILLMAEVPGWVRSRRFVLRPDTDGHTTGTGKDATEAGKDAAGIWKEGAPKYLAIHEFENGKEREESVQYKTATSTPWRARMQGFMTYRERRDFELVRRWDRE